MIFYYLQVVPHITDAIQSWVERVAKIPVSSDMSEPKVDILVYHKDRSKLL